MMRLNEQDRAAVARYIDGEMTAADKAAFDAKLQAEPLLAEAAADAEALRGWFARADGDSVPALRPGFSDRVLQRLRHAQGTTDNPQLERRVLRLARLCMIAAAIVFTVAMLFATGVLRVPDSGHLQADSSSELIRALDAAITAAQQAGARR